MYMYLYRRALLRVPSLAAATFKPAAASTLLRTVQRTAVSLHAPAVTVTVRSFSTADAAAATTSAAGGSTLDRSEIESRVLAVVKKFPKVDSTKVTATSSFNQDLGLDSLDAVELVMELEEEFAIEINDQDADKITSTKDAIEFLSKHPSAK